MTGCQVRGVKCQVLETEPDIIPLSGTWDLIHGTIPNSRR